MPDKIVKKDARLGFKVGTQQAVDAILSAGSGAVHGSFYLATDTHRLYIGNEDTSLSPVNEGIITVQHLSELPDPSAGNAGQFYYITGETDSVKNVLTVSNGHQWVHINANTNTYISSHGFTSVDITGGAQLESNIQGTDSSTKTGRFHITGSNGVQISRKTTTINVGGTNVSVPVIDIKTDAYFIDAEQDGTNKVKLNVNSMTPIAGGEFGQYGNPAYAANTYYVWDNTAQKYVLASATTPDSNKTYYKKNEERDSSITIQSSPDTQNNATTVGITETDGVISISARDTRNKDVSVTNASSGTGFTVNVQDDSNATKSGSFDPKIQLGTHSNQLIGFTNGTAVLNVYTKGEIDATMQALNAMTYRGTLGDGGSAGTILDGTSWKPLLNNEEQNVSVGDTFLTTSTIAYDGQQVPKGSLLIVREGEEDANGFITSGLKYDVVKATQDTDTQYTFEATTDGLYLKSSTGANRGQLAISQGTAMAVSFVSSDAGSGSNAVSNGKQTITIAHANVAHTETPGTAVEGGKANSNNNFQGSTVIPVVTGVTVNAQGHVTDVETTNYTVYDTNSRITASTYSTAVHNNNSTTPNKNVGTITHTLTTTHGAGGHNTVTSTEAISSESLKISVENTNYTSDSDHSTVNGLNIEMVWGEF